MTQSERPIVSIIMGSQSDWPVMKEASKTLTELNIPHECKIVSAHRTPDRLYSFAAEAASQGIKVIIAGAGGAAHLPGMAAAMTHLPVIGVPVKSKALSGVDDIPPLAAGDYGVVYVVTVPRIGRANLLSVDYQASTGR